MNAKDILAQLEQHRSLIVTVSCHSYGTMKSRISNTRSRMIAKLPENERPDDKLQFYILLEGEDTLQVRISLVDNCTPIDGIINVKPAEDL